MDIKGLLVADNRVFSPFASLPEGRLYLALIEQAFVDYRLDLKNLRRGGERKDAKGRTDGHFRHELNVTHEFMDLSKEPSWKPINASLCCELLAEDPDGMRKALSRVWERFKEQCEQETMRDAPKLSKFIRLTSPGSSEFSLIGRPSERQSEQSGGCDDLIAS